MRIRGAYSVYKRVLPSGELVYYYQTYNEEGRRLPGRSTGKSTRTAAKAYCDMLLREGLMGTGDENKKIPFFKDYAKGWWDFETCEYVRSKTLREGGIAASYVASSNNYLKNHVLPYFKDRRLDKITDEDIDKWLLSLTEKSLMRSSVKTAFKVFSVMMGYAQKKKRYIKYNPCVLVDRLSNAVADIDILRPSEIQDLFPDDWSSVWDNHACYVLCKLAAHTGMRFGELLGVRGDHVYEKYIHVESQYSRWGVIPVKTKKPRYITIPENVEADLRELMKTKGEGFLFTANDERTTPMNRRTVYKNLFAALERIGISETERKKRHLSMHGFRHFFNTYLLAGNINDSKVMAMTGHETKEMKKRYTHFNPDDFADVIALQAKLLQKEPPKAPEEKQPDRGAAGNITPFRLPENDKENAV